MRARRGGYLATTVVGPVTTSTSRILSPRKAASTLSFGRRAARGLTLSLWAAALGSGCGVSAPRAETVAASSSPIQGGTVDTTDTFVVAIVRQDLSTGEIALCSGALLAPNLVATARHCVATLSSDPVDCLSTTFGAVSPPSDVFVTTDTTLSGNDFYTVSEIIVPSEASEKLLCGNDIALLILSQSISLSQYVTPVINPPMTDHNLFTTAITAIGYGLDSPADVDASSAGVRRILENVDLECISGDPVFADCLSEEDAATETVVAGEFASVGGTCTGDSGSGAFEQRNFNDGKWVSFGVLSRGSVSTDGTTCEPAVYTRFDAWGSLLNDAANEAAQMGGYALPAWATPSPSQSSATEGGTCVANALTCSADGDCCSHNCLSHDQGITFTCSACSNSDPCDVGYSCDSATSTCVLSSADDAGAAGATASHASQRASGKGCSVGAVGGRASARRRHPGEVSWIAASLVLGLVWRRRRNGGHRRHGRVASASEA